MSSTVSTTEIQTIPPKAVTKLKMEEKPPRLVRTSSIEKIKRFNTFICSQQYYLLPALLSWLRSSQSGLHSSTEKTIFLFRSIIFNTFFYKLYLMAFKSGAPHGWTVEKVQRDIRIALVGVISNFYRKFTKCFESTFLLAVAVYAACAVVLLQLFLALYLMYFALLPYGFFFLIGCIATIIYLCYGTMFYFLARNTKRDIRYK